MYEKKGIWGKNDNQKSTYWMILDFFAVFFNTQQQKQEQLTCHSFIRVEFLIFRHTMQLRYEKFSTSIVSSRYNTKLHNGNVVYGVQDATLYKIDKVFINWKKNYRESFSFTFSLINEKILLLFIELKLAPT